MNRDRSKGGREGDERKREGVKKTKKELGKAGIRGEREREQEGEIGSASSRERV